MAEPALDLNPDHLIRSEAELREVFGGTHWTIWEKAAPYLSEPMQRFILKANLW